MSSWQPLPPITPAEAATELLKRREARRCMAGFVRYLNPDFIWSDFAESVCAALDQFIDDCMAGLRPVLILEAPPQHGKSELVSRMLPAYIFGRFPDQRVAGLSYAKDLAADMNRDVQAVMMSPEYAVLFPDSALNQKRVVQVEAEARRNSDMFEIVGHKGAYVGQGVGGPLTGKRVDIGIIDDPIKNSKEALSPTVKEAIWKWYGSTFMTRLSKNSGQIIMATRWAVDDLSGRVLESNKRARRLTYPAIDDSGAALVPDLHPIDKLLEMKAAISEYFWSAMYQQSPFIPGGGMFDVTQFKIVHHAPPIIKTVRYWDKAGTDGGGAYTAGVKMAMTKDGQFIVLDVVRGQWAALERERRIKQTAELDGSGIDIWIEQEPGSGGKESAEATIRNLVGHVIRAERVTGDKVSRADPYSVQVCGGNVMLLKADWNKAFIDEHETFPAGTYKDQIDAASGAFNKLVTGVSRAPIFGTYGNA